MPDIVVVVVSSDQMDGRTTSVRHSYGTVRSAKLEFSVSSNGVLTFSTIYSGYIINNNNVTCTAIVSCEETIT